MFDYWLERFRFRVFLPVAVALAWPAQMQPSGSILTLALDSGFALLLLAQFRLLDDLADRVSDTSQHPERVLVRSRRPASYVVVCVALTVVNIAIVVWRDGTSIGLPLLAAVTAALAIEGWPRSSKGRSASGDLFRLSKYPAFVAIIAAGRPDASAAVVSSSAILVYLASCAYEMWHDPATPLRLLVRSPR